VFCTPQLSDSTDRGCRFLFIFSAAGTIYWGNYL
jgi:hypothetical protein